MNLARVPIATLLLSCFTSASAFAVGLNLSWDDCGAAGAADKAFSCDTNSGEQSFECSIMAPAEATDIYLVTGALLFSFDGGVLPSWWQLHNAGTCRASADSLAVRSAHLAGCLEAWSDQAIGLIGAYLPDNNNPGWRRLIWAAEVPQADAFALVEGEEYHVATVVISNVSTVGPGACAGCEQGIHVEFQDCTLYRVAAGSIDVTLPATRSSVTWQGGQVPVLNRTWGSIKTLYR